jgi:hypothetical protein
MGSILITQEGAETSTIEESRRNESLYNFYMMLDEALAEGDCCFMVEAAYQHVYSYGNYFPAFVNLSWEEFNRNESLKGVSYNTYNYITNNLRNIYPKKITNEEEFERTKTPRGKGGFEHADSRKDFLCNIARWKKWHCDYLTAHPKEIEWRENSYFISNVNVVYEILEEEILIYIGKKYKERINKANNAELEIKRIWNELFADKNYHINEDATQSMKNNVIALFFHHVVMPSIEHNSMTAYCKEIGRKVCQANYYQYEPELSTNEQQACGSSRQIYSIIKNGVKQYISLDFHKGMFEFHDNNGRHLGEFLFDGTWNKKAEEDHNFKTLQ